jgi:hypothetical protein
MKHPVPHPKDSLSLLMVQYSKDTCVKNLPGGLLAFSNIYDTKLHRLKQLLQQCVTLTTGLRHSAIFLAYLENSIAVIKKVNEGLQKRL